MLARDNGRDNRTWWKHNRLRRSLLCFHHVLLSLPPLLCS